MEKSAFFGQKSNGQRNKVEDIQNLLVRVHHLSRAFHTKQTATNLVRPTPLRVSVRVNFHLTFFCEKFRGKTFFRKKL